MIRAFKNSYKLSLLLAIVFFVSILISAYALYELPRELHLSDGFQSVLGKTYVTLGLSFLFGGIALYVALQSKREILVYRDRSHETDENNNSNTANETKTTITLEGVKAGLQQAQNE